MTKVCMGCHSRNRQNAKFCDGCGTRFPGESPERHLTEGDVFDVMKRNDKKTMQKYIRSGCRITVADGDGYTPLHWAAEYGHLAIVKVLIQKGADINARTLDGWTACDLSRTEGHRKVEEYLTDMMVQGKKAPAAKPPKAVKTAKKK